MHRAAAIVALLVWGQTAASAQAWSAEVGITALAESWDRNETYEWLGGGVAAVDRHLWRALALRGEGLVLRVAQTPGTAWLAGATIGLRGRWGQGRTRRIVDVAGGWSHATHPVPPRGTAGNYLAVIGAGVEWPWATRTLTVAGRWLHISNNGRDGRHRNPDLQSPGVALSVGWKH